MTGFRSILRVCLPIIIIGSAAYSISRCSNDYMYKSTAYELNESRPKCREIEQRLGRIRGLKRSSVMKYLIGEYGEVEAIRKYRESYCRQQENLNNKII